MESKARAVLGAPGVFHLVFSKVRQGRGCIALGTQEDNVAHCESAEVFIDVSTSGRKWGKSWSIGSF